MITYSDIETITEWHCLQYRHDYFHLRCEPVLTILRLDQSSFNIVITSSWYWTLSSRRKSFRIVYYFSISHNNVMFILWQLKIKASGNFFLSCSYEKFVNYFQTGLLYLKFISNTVNGNTYWGRHTNFIKLNTDLYYPLSNNTPRVRPITWSFTCTTLALQNNFDVGKRRHIKMSLQWQYVICLHHDENPTKNPCYQNISPRHWKTGLVSSGASLTSWREGATVALLATILVMVSR